MVGLSPDLNEKFSQKQDLGKHLLTHLNSSTVKDAPSVSDQQVEPSGAVFLEAPEPQLGDLNFAV